MLLLSFPRPGSALLPSGRPFSRGLFSYHCLGFLRGISVPRPSSEILSGRTRCASGCCAAPCFGIFRSALLFVCQGAGASPSPPGLWMLVASYRSAVISGNFIKISQLLCFVNNFFNFFQKFVVAYYRSQFVCGEIHYNTIRIYLSMPIFIYFTFCCTASLRQKLQRNKAEFFQYALDSICDIIMLIKPRKDSAVLCI